MTEVKKGRPPSAARQEALLMGDNKYQGKRCRSCDGTERYTHGGACVVCQSANGRRAREALKAERIAETLAIEVEEINQEHELEIFEVDSDEDAGYSGDEQEAEESNPWD